MLTIAQQSKLQLRVEVHATGPIPALLIRERLPFKWLAGNKFNEFTEDKQGSVDGVVFFRLKTVIPKILQQLAGDTVTWSVACLFVVLNWPSKVFRKKRTQKGTFGLTAEVLQSLFSHKSGLPPHTTVRFSNVTPLCLPFIYRDHQSAVQLAVSLEEVMPLFYHILLQLASELIEFDFGWCTYLSSVPLHTTHIQCMNANRCRKMDVFSPCIEAPIHRYVLHPGDSHSRCGCHSIDIPSNLPVTSHLNRAANSEIAVFGSAGVEVVLRDG